MGSSALRQLLRSVCSNSQWKYAVLWRIRHGNPLLLSWEDGYIDCPKPRQVSEDLYCNHAGDASELNSGNVGLVVSELSQIQYTFGEGLVGQVAMTGNHSWVSFRNVFNDEGNLNSVCSVPEEWLLQFASGIKTILLIPLLPLGVLQLGSLEEMCSEFLNVLVASLKGQFYGFHNVRGNTASVTLKRDAEDMSLCSTNNLCASPGLPIKPVKSEDPDHLMTLADVKPGIDNIIPGSSQLLPLLSEHVLRPSGNDLLEAIKYERHNEIDGPSADCIVESIPVESLNSSQMNYVEENKLFELSLLMEVLQSYPEFTNYNLGVLGESFSESMTAYADQDVAETLYREDTEYNPIKDFLNFPPDSELLEVLRPALWEQSREIVWELPSNVDGTHQSSNFICNQQLIDGKGPSWVGCSADTEYLLDAVVSNVHGGSVDMFSASYNCRSSPNSSERISTDPKLQKLSEKSFSNDDSSHRRHIIFECSGRDKSPDASSATLTSMMSTVLDKKCQKGSLQGHKEQKTSKCTIRKAKPGGSQKPRPRDRQLIQDRVKELRELVPNGGKCSIDGLLERTINHMMYLRSVAEQAEKLKQWALQEVTDPKNRRSATETRNNQHTGNGTSWAFELDANPKTCPIVVEDLSCPGHMLIEMLCNEHGFFLEIVQEIRDLELTILKGVMECRDGQTWAHFIVQASQGFHRLDIFWPLMRLLQRMPPISSKI